MNATPLSEFTWYRGNLEWLRARTIYLVKHGSQAYGTSLPTSDLDIKGVAIPPAPYFLGALHRFEQAESKDPDAVVFDIRKFVSLASDCNPNIIEILFVDADDVLLMTPAGQELRTHRHLFLSKRAQYSFSGYAMAQLKRIKTHRRWLLEPPKKHPERADFGLSEQHKVDRDSLAAVEARVRKAEDKLGGEGWTKDRVATRDEDLVLSVVGDLDLDKKIIPIILAERRYAAAMRNWAAYEKWKAERNPKRAELEARFGYDCYLDDTEFLTADGWKRYDDIDDMALLGTVDQQTGGLEWQRCSERVAKPYSGPMFFLESRTTACAVTPNHRMWLSPAKRSRATGFSTSYDPADSAWQFQAMEAAAGGTRSWYHARVSAANQADAELSDELLILVGAYVSEGCVGKRLRDGSPSVLRISQREGGRLCGFMDQVSGVRTYAYLRRPTARRARACTELVWTLAARALSAQIVAWCGDGSANKCLPPWIATLSHRQANLLLDVLISGDGTERPMSRVYYTMSRQLADDVQTLCLLAGRTSQIWGPYGYDDGRPPMFQVYVGKDGLASPVCLQEGGPHLKREHVDGRIVCFTVPNEVLVTRRNGKVAIQGNTKHGMHLVRLMRMATEILGEQRVLVRRPDADELLAIRGGAWSYDRLMAWAEETEARLATIAATSTLRKSPDREAIDRVLVEIVSHYLAEN